MSFFNSRGVFLQLMQPSHSEPNTQVSMQLARKEENWDEQSESVVESLVDSMMVTAISKDGGNTFSIGRLGQDVDGDGVIGDEDKTKLAALAKAYANIVNP
ncbi:hypothetical protein [Pseudomonas atagonensis]|uniref:hypothetical protein n=1 Tax=Pseudomonas atagonensis TaxID=2609964 RepID=UPI00140869E4|nr:hypothetical protein [Pseudomonas atagonensis]